MSGHAKAVLWMGLVMIIAHIVLQWSQISSLLFGSGGPGGATGGDVRGNPVPTTVPPGKNGKCPPGYSPQAASNGGIVCRLHSRLPL